MNKMSEEQIQILIDFVQARPGLYDKRESSYKKVEWKDKCWREIASNLCADEKDCKAAWRSLKDQFVKRQKELKGKTGQTVEEFPKKYKNFERLLFLKDSIEPRNHCSNYDDWSTNDPELSFSETDVMDLTFSEKSTTQTVPVPYISPVSASASCSSGIKRKICSQSGPFFDFERCASTSYIAPAPEASPSESSEMRDFCSEASSSSSSKKRKAENLKDTFSGFLDKLANTIEAKEPDNIDVFFESIEKSAKSFSLTPVEQSTLMMGVIELLHEIVSDRHK